MALYSKITVLGVLITPEVPFFCKYFQLTEQEKVYVYINLCIYMYLYKRKFIWQLILKSPFNNVFSPGAVEEILCSNNQIITLHAHLRSERLTLCI